MSANGNGEVFSVSGRAILVSGGTTGIGLATANLLAKASARVLASRNGSIVAMQVRPLMQLI